MLDNDVAGFEDESNGSDAILDEEAIETGWPENAVSTTLAFLVTSTIG